MKTTIKTTMKTTMITGAIAIALAAPAYAELEGELSLSYDSQYSYRGMNDLLSQASGGATDDAITTELNVSYGLSDQWSLVAGAAVNAIISDDAEGVEVARYHGGLRYTAECYTLELGYQQQDLPFGGFTATSEIYLNLGTKCPLT
ncbi:MAG: hypothetical protein QNK86_04960, partial [Akkermansiaceae bacterium]